ncbi:MAG: FeoB-associated Cys-rich membrane protein [Clostridia bacterium]|nr:FeoB-associated Cys-rich membrane protein [Clostridia bacterium]
MSLLDWILLILLAAAIVAAVYLLIRNRRHGSGCSGDCSRCSGCPHIDHHSR